ncbi:cell surface protein [Thozetella sp. PMI_491]|nr:cell surface protein [Thozetella sp. PMI_491]
MALKVNVVVPLYIYPLTEATWKPLYDSIAAHPQLNFLVIVNPNSGPGASPLPSHDYVREVPKLNSFPNVRTVGYVAIGYCQRPLRESLQDIQLYAGWSRDHAIEGLHVQGIYVDETPNHASDHSSKYLDDVRDFIKELDGLQGDRLVIHNPGTPPEGALALFGSPDLVCVCEEPYSHYQLASVQKRIQDYVLDQDRSMLQISGIPSGDLPRVVADLCGRGSYIFGTTLVDSFYESFGPDWAEFVAAVQALIE